MVFDTLATCLLCLIPFAVFVYAVAEDAGKGIGYAEGYKAAKNEMAAAAWAASAEGEAAYLLSQAGSILQLARCANPGWYIKNGVCLPARARDGLHGWRIKPP